MLAEQVISDHEESARVAIQSRNRIRTAGLQAPVAERSPCHRQLASDRPTSTGWAPWPRTWPRSRGGATHTHCPNGAQRLFRRNGRVAVELGNSAREVLLSRTRRRLRRSAKKTTRWTTCTGTSSTLMDRGGKHGVAAAVDVTLLGQFYERFADHAVRDRPR